MSHVNREKAKLLNRMKRIRGQMESVERKLAEEQHDCADVLMLLAAVRGGINGLMAEVMEDHIRMHVVAATQEPNAEQAQAAEELIEVVRSYLK